MPIGPLALATLAAGAWLRPDDQRAALLTVAALLGAAIAASRAPVATDATPLPVVIPLRLSDDELRAAIAAW